MVLLFFLQFIFDISGTNSTLFIRPKPFHFAIVDEVDSVLIDEGRNPLLISGEVYFVIISCDPLALMYLLVPSSNFQFDVLIFFLTFICISG